MPNRFEHAPLLRAFASMHGLPPFTFVETVPEKQELFGVGLNQRKIFEDSVDREAFIVSFLSDANPYHVQWHMKLNTEGCQRRHQTMPPIVNPTSILQAPFLPETLRTVWGLEAPAPPDGTGARLREYEERYEAERERHFAGMVKRWAAMGRLV